MYMNMNLEEVKAELNRLSAIVNDEFDIEFAINGRLTRTLGRVIMVGSKARGYQPTKLELSKQLLETATVESIKEVIAHEFAHYYITKTTRENHGHDAQFKALCQRLGGGDGKTSTKVNRTVEVQSKYDTFCTSCGKPTGSFSRAGKKVKNPELYRSCCCKAPIRVVQNF